MYNKNLSLKTGVYRIHTPHGMSIGYSAATIDVTSLPMHIEQVLAAVSSMLCSCMAISKVWESPLTTMCIL